MDLVRAGDSEVAVGRKLEVREERRAEVGESPALCFRAWPKLTRNFPDGQDTFQQTARVTK